MSHSVSAQALRRLTALLILVIATLPAVAQEIEAAKAAAKPPAPIRHFRVTWMHEPATQAVISWTTTDEGEDHRVYYGTEPRDGKIDSYSESAASARSGAYKLVKRDGDIAPAYYHHVHLTGLEPGTTYYFTAASDDHKSPEFYFITAPDDDREVKLLFGGDSRRGGRLDQPHEDRRSMNRRMRELVAEHPEILALAHGGDYTGRAEWAYLTDWLDDHQLTFQEDGRILPIIPTRGNHERGPSFEEVFWSPTLETPYYYATTLSANVAILTLNTETSHGGDQAEWLEEELRSLRPTHRWVIAQYHRPMWGSVKAEKAARTLRQFWAPLFEKYNIDLALESDHHMLKRTVPIRNEQRSDDGIIYIGDGGLGVPQRAPDLTRWYLQDGGFAKPAHHVHLLEFGTDRLRVRAIGMDGEVLDELELQSRDKAALTAVGQ